MNREGVSTFDMEHYMTRLCGKVVLVILSILSFKTSLWFFLTQKKLKSTLKINKRE